MENRGLVWSGQQNTLNTEGVFSVEIQSEEDEIFEKLGKMVIAGLIEAGVVEKRDGRMVLGRVSDLDGMMSEYLCRAAGIAVDDLTQEGGGEKGTDGSSVKLRIDRENTEQMGCVSKVVYRLFCESGLIEPTLGLEGAILFIEKKNEVNDSGFKATTDYLLSHLTVSGLGEYLYPEELVRYFEHNQDPNEPTNLKELAWLHLDEEWVYRKSQEKRWAIEQNLLKILELKQEGFQVSSEKYGEMLISIGEESVDVEGAFALGYDVVLRWIPTEDRFIAVSKNPLGEEFDLWGAGGKNKCEGALERPLDELLRVFVGGEFEPEEELKEYLAKEPGRQALRDLFLGKKTSVVEESELVFEPKKVEEYNEVHGLIEEAAKSGEEVGSAEPKAKKNKTLRERLLDLARLSRAY